MTDVDESISHDKLNEALFGDNDNIYDDDDDNNNDTNISKKRPLEIDIYTYEDRYDIDFLEKRRKLSEIDSLKNKIKKTKKKDNNNGRRRSSKQPKNKLEKKEFIKDSFQNKMKRESNIKLKEKVKTFDINQFFSAIKERKNSLNIITPDQICDDENDNDEIKEEEEEEENKEEKENEDKSEKKKDILSDDDDDDDNGIRIYEEEEDDDDDDDLSFELVIKEDDDTLKNRQKDENDDDDDDDDDEIKYESYRRKILLESHIMKKKLNDSGGWKNDSESIDIMNIIMKDKSQKEKSLSSSINSSFFDSQFDETARDSFEPELYRDSINDEYTEKRKSELNKLKPRSNTKITFASAVLFQSSSNDSSSSSMKESSKSFLRRSSSRKSIDG